MPDNAEITNNESHLIEPKEKLLLEPLSQTKCWVRIFSVMCFISGALMVIAVLGMMMFGGNIPASDTGLPSGVMTGMSIFYLLLSVIYFTPSYYLYKYANAIKLAEDDCSIDNLSSALAYQKSFWKFAGIVMVIMIGIAITGIVAAILLPMMFG
jgi:hypothetical protein